MSESSQHPALRQEGGKYLTNGSYGCVFKPPLRCAEHGARSQFPSLYSRKTVGKVFHNSDEFEEERASIEQVIQKLDPDHTYTTRLKHVCTTAVPLHSRERNHPCSRLKSHDQQLIIEDGGVDLHTWVHRVKSSKLSRHSTRHDLAVRAFWGLFKRLGPLLRGISVLNTQGAYVHNDIKPTNLLYASKKVTLIDFGLMTRKSKMYAANDRSQINLLATDYAYWPVEHKALKATTRAQLSPSSLHAYLHANMSTLPFLKTSWETWMTHIGVPIREGLHELSNALQSMATVAERAKWLTQTCWDKVDSYALGITLLELYARLNVPEWQLSPTMHMRMYMVRDLMRQMVDVNPMRRVSCAQAAALHDAILRMERQT
jgi:serine/threonine protein kinase